MIAKLLGRAGGNMITAIMMMMEIGSIEKLEMLVLKYRIKIIVIVVLIISNPSSNEDQQTTTTAKSLIILLLLPHHQLLVLKLCNLRIISPRKNLERDILRLERQRISQQQLPQLLLIILSAHSSQRVSSLVIMQLQLLLAAIAMTLTIM